MGTRNLPYWVEDLISGLGILVGVFAACVVFVAVVAAALSYGPIRITCERQAAAMGLEERWGFWEGCLVVHDGTVVEIDELRRVR